MTPEERSVLQRQADSQKMMNKSNRDNTIDILRGIAIVTMVCANSAGYILQEPHPLGIRLYGTWAAPLFILLAGFMVTFTQTRKKYNFSHYLMRGGLLLVIASLLDSLNFGDYPLISFDVLYLIAFSIPLSFGFHQLKLLPQVVIVTVIVMITPLLQKLLGYTDLPIDVPIFPEKERTIDFIAEIPTIFKHWLIDGWFPLFPWLSFSFIGVILARLRQEFPSFASQRFILSGLACFFGGLTIWFVELQNLNTNTGLAPYMPLFQFHKLLTRDGYSEMFYPPTIGYCLVAIGLILLLFVLVDGSNKLPLYKPLEILGQCSLFMYLLHYTIIEKILSKVVPKELLPIGQFLLVYLTFMIILMLVAWGVSILKQQWQKPPYIVKFILGG